MGVICISYLCNPRFCSSLLTLPGSYGMFLTKVLFAEWLNSGMAGLLWGEVSERLKEHAWKACARRKVGRGFESRPLRQICLWQI